MQIQLPPSKSFRQFCRHENGWSDHYGALQAAATYSGLVLPPCYDLLGVWQHGVFGPWQHFHPTILVYNAPRAAQRPVFVAREDQVKLLGRHGFKQVRAIGMPILYTPEPALDRVPGSLLVVPTHSLSGDNHPDRSAFERYADSIMEVAGRFSRVVACIHPHCGRNGLWVKEFTERGIEIVYGAETTDANALLRMRTLFSQFESVTTNEWGSHVAYALAFGARVSIAGVPIVGDPALHARDEMWKNDPAAMVRAFSPEVVQARRKFLERLYLPPTEGVVDKELGRWFIGADHQLPPAEMAAALKLLITPEPQALARVRVAGAAAGPFKRILFVSHEASRTGAPMFLLHFLRWLSRHTTEEFDILVRKDGPLTAEFATVGHVITPAELERNPACLQDYALVYSNTLCNGTYLGQFDLAGIPVVTHIHELEYGADACGARNFAEVVRHTGRYIACAQAVADQLTRRFRIDPATISVHYEMFDPQQTDANAAAVTPQQARLSQNIPADAHVICACGTVDLRKGADLFVQLAAKMVATWRGERPLHFVWIGKCNEPHILQLLGHDVRRAGLAGRMTFAGEQANPHALLQLADIFVLTSREDPFPLVMLEATAMSKPLVCFDRSGGAAELCALGAGRAVPFLDVEAMASQCVAYLTNEDARLAAGRAASEVVRANFVPAAVAPKLWAEVAAFAQAGQASLPQPRAVAEIYSGWLESELPQPEYVQRALRRQRLVKEVRASVRLGRKSEAAQMLIRGITAAVETRDGFAMIEAILEFAAELVPLEQQKALALLQQGEQIMRNLPPNSDFGRIYLRELERVRQGAITAGRASRVA